MMRVLYPAGFGIVLAAWTWLLVEPKPVPDSFLGGGGWFDTEMLKFVLAKLLHFGMYTFLAAAGGGLGRGRWPLVLAAILVLHGGATEIAQTYVPNRHGCVRDVFIDAAGVAAGTLLFAWYRGRQRRRGQPGG